MSVWVVFTLNYICRADTFWSQFRVLFLRVSRELIKSSIHIISNLTIVIWLFYYFNYENVLSISYCLLHLFSFWWPFSILRDTSLMLNFTARKYTCVERLTIYSSLLIRSHLLLSQNAFYSNIEVWPRYFSTLFIYLFHVSTLFIVFPIRWVFSLIFYSLCWTSIWILWSIEEGFWKTMISFCCYCQSILL